MRQAGSSEAPICLKLTLLNPRTTVADVQAILEAVVRHGRAVAGAEAAA